MEKIYNLNRKYNTLLTIVFVLYVVVMGVVFLAFPIVNKYILLIGLFVLSVLKITSDAMKSIKIKSVKINTKMDEDLKKRVSISRKDLNTNKNSSITLESIEDEWGTEIESETSSSEYDNENTEVFKLEIDVAKSIVDTINPNAFLESDYYEKAQDIQKIIEDAINQKLIKLKNKEK